MAQKSKLWYLENFNLFDCLTPESVKEFDKMLKMKNFTKNSVIYFADDPSDSLFILKEGSVKLIRISPEGKEIITKVLQPGEIFGELALANESLREDTAIATDDTVICTVTVEQFEQALIRNPKLNLKMTKLIGLRLQKVERNLENLIFKDSTSRIKYFLKNYANEYGKKLGNEIFIKTNLTHQDIAELTATSRQTVTTVLNSLKEKNILDFARKKIVIRSIDEL